MSEEKFPKIQRSGEAIQSDFFDVLDTAIPNEDLRTFKLTPQTEIIFDPKESNVFYIFDYISQTTAEVHFDRSGKISSLSVVRMGGEAGDIEGSWKIKHEKTAEKILSEQSEFLDL